MSPQYKSLQLVHQTSRPWNAIKHLKSQCQHVAQGALTSPCFHLSIRYHKTSHQRPWPSEGRPPNWSMPRRPQKHSQPFLRWNRKWIVNINRSNSKILMHEIKDTFLNFYQDKLIQYVCSTSNRHTNVWQVVDSHSSTSVQPEFTWFSEDRTTGSKQPFTACRGITRWSVAGDVGKILVNHVLEKKLNKALAKTPATFAFVMPWWS